MVERWTRQRRVEHTRNLLLDAAEEVVARQGFGAAALEVIAESAGYTRGAIYSHFGTKEELFLAVMERQLQRFLDGFNDIVDSFRTVGDFDSDQLADRWRMLTIAEPHRAALGYEFTLFLLRNPEVRERVAAQRQATAQSLADYIDAHLVKIGARLRVPSQLLAKVLIATYEGITLGSHIDSENLYRPYLEMVMSHVEPADPEAAQPS
ncbi:TetR/AcrR family transcriptional regulator [Mycolicibacterium fallax]|uniref:TetR family transcriptional regulator n=1 Tax=Mycolicibacterium fallax TaxID=1793 RepID=A0A1X1RI27_MYCFA|nr:TetR/AcrR family transcriptional regulator [Mycolicibacterium fallax]ORV06699.1 TetR family transcriptional regulator [Mycolicibacterium fallax]BBY96647.1 TetR family transcriptional regulator [Mycolicibacterium fallax]HSA40406.1 helix-turn-helix domain-containing protein [Mycobacterium sp.]